MLVWTIIWKSITLSVTGMVLLRIAGRKSVAEMTIPQIATIITIGSILGSDVGAKGIGHSIIAAAIFVSLLVVIEWISLHWNRTERTLKGGPVLIIDNGKILTDKIKRLRLTVDDVEKRLRVAGVAHISDVQTGILEANGELGLELIMEARPVTVRDLERILNFHLAKYTPEQPQQPEDPNLFTEVVLDTNVYPNLKELH